MSTEALLCCGKKSGRLDRCRFAPGALGWLFSFGTFFKHIIAVTAFCRNYSDVTGFFQMFQMVVHFFFRLSDYLGEVFGGLFSYSEVLQNVLADRSGSLFGDEGLSSFFDHGSSPLAVENELPE